MPFLGLFPIKYDEDHSFEIHYSEDLQKAR
jgi:hypothetical protein